MKQKINMREALGTAVFVLTIATMVLMLTAFVYCLMNTNEVVDVIKTINYISTGLLCIVWPLSVLVAYCKAFRKGRRYERERQKNTAKTSVVSRESAAN